MSASVIVAIVSIVITFFLAIVTHICVSVWWASKITTTLGFLRESLQKMEKHQDGYYTKEEAIRENTTAGNERKAMFARLDEMRLRVDQVEKEIAYIKGGTNEKERT